MDCCVDWPKLKPFVPEDAAGWLAAKLKMEDWDDAGCTGGAEESCISVLSTWCPPKPPLIPFPLPFIFAKGFDTGCACVFSDEPNVKEEDAPGTLNWKDCDGGGKD